MNFENIFKGIERIKKYLKEFTCKSKTATYIFKTIFKTYNHFILEKYV